MKTKLLRKFRKKAKALTYIEAAVVKNQCDYLLVVDGKILTQYETFQQAAKMCDELRRLDILYLASVYRSKKNEKKSIIKLDY